MPPQSKIGFLIQHLAFSLGRTNDQVLQEQLGIGFSRLVMTDAAGEFLSPSLPVGT